ncbi:hypothetical protein SAMN05443543_109157 [Flavobacterium flevense]|uniref:Uncharacterized protein n=1 Tax=Flavobacterium flevense TaxID=983 RepID=A0A4Y4AXV3_9FLAO|nr:hypothetical protein [Flavobacterium flevense]GEC71243.1 hypothetical protein FFL01_07820 [Flavobacterium flevense]SHM05483.1 hypothetical protein SAMN05443543_109157 [Flavobacterium flevense]
MTDRQKKLLLELKSKKEDCIQKEAVDFWDELSLSQQKKIEKGIEELNKGKRIEFNELLKKIS